MFTKYFSIKVKILITLFLNRKITIKKILNIVYSSIAYRFKLSNSSKYPVVINMELSNKCNERCVFCRDEKGNFSDEAFAFSIAYHHSRRTANERVFDPSRQYYHRSLSASETSPGRIPAQ